MGNKYGILYLHINLFSGLRIWVDLKKKIDLQYYYKLNYFLTAFIKNNEINNKQRVFYLGNKYYRILHNFTFVMYKKLSLACVQTS